MSVLEIAFLSAAILLLVILSITISLFLRSKKSYKALEAELRPLEQYKVIPDANRRASETIREAQHRAQEIVEAAERSATTIIEEGRREAEQVRNEATRLLEETKKATAEERKKAQEKARELRETAEKVAADATIEAARVIDEARKKAQEVAGSAYEAMGRAEEFQRIAIAMENKIEGYGDRYIIPSYTLLDELADEFGFAEAGQKLKSARAQMRLMAENGTAATCQYVETNRKETAIRFVLDAFNGKVEEILSRVRHDNHGTLAQQIKDAFALVNRNGAAFRDARVTPEFLSVRLDELHWAAVAHQLRVQEREEQRQIRERMREEEKARKEFERAIKEAAKEEDTLRKAMEKVQKEVERASEEQRAAFEAQLADLQRKLEEAEAKNQRALSMAQQTKSGHVYVISNVGSFGENVYKIGMTRRLEPLDRVRELGDASVPFEFDVHALIHSEDAPGLERELQKRFIQLQVNKVNPRKEFFRVALRQIREIVETRGLQVSWTMAAEAREYRETLAIEQAMAADTTKADEWLRHQMEETDRMATAVEAGDLDDSAA